MIGLSKHRDPIRDVVRRAEVQVKVNGESITLVSGLYNLPQPVGGLYVDCPVTQGYNLNSDENRWSLKKDVRLRFWLGSEPLMEPDTFVYPIRQRWFASQSWFDNEPVDGGEEVWDFGDGSPEVHTQSGKSTDPHASDGYTFIEHAYDKPGQYIVHTYRENTDGKQSHAHLYVTVGE